MSAIVFGVKPKHIYFYREERNVMPRVAVVTGGTRGIGAAISTALKEEGYKVAATYAGNDKAANDFKEETGIDVYKFDVANFSDCQKGCEDILSDLGEIDVLINNAGITRDAFLHKMSEQDWGDVIATNLGSCFNMCRILVPNMRNRGFGRVVNISSINGVKGQLGQANYAAAKAGIIGFSKSLAQENARKGITVNVVCPGYVETEMTKLIDNKILEGIISTIPTGRMAKPNEIGEIVSYLVSDSASYVNGSTLHINGGQYMT